MRYSVEKNHEYCKKYREENKEKYNEYKRNYMRERSKRLKLEKSELIGLALILGGN